MQKNEVQVLNSSGRSCSGVQIPNGMKSKWNEPMKTNVQIRIARLVNSRESERDRNEK